MWEFTIILPLERENLAKKIFKYTKKLTTKHGGLVTIYKNLEIQILLASDKLNRPILQASLANYLIDSILEEYKLEYLHNNLNLKTFDKLKSEAYYNALLYFDFENDRDILRKNLIFKNKIVVESLINFRLQELTTKWKNLCLINSQNSNYLLYNDTFYEFLKFLIDNLENTFDEINIYYKNSNYYMFDKNNNELGDDLIDYPLIKNESQVLSSLIKLCPRKIKIHCDLNKSNDIFSIISNIFEDRVEFINTV